MKADADRIIDLVARDLVAREPSRSVDLSRIHDSVAGNDEQPASSSWVIPSCLAAACAAVAVFLAWSSSQNLNLATPYVPTAIALEVPSVLQPVRASEAEARSTRPAPAAASRVTVSDLAFEQIDIDPVEVGAVELAPITIDPAEIPPIVVEPLTASND